MCTQFPDAKTVQINLTGFLESSTPVFMSELWEMLTSAQSNIGGIPSSILEAKKAEILAAKVRIEPRALVPAHVSSGQQADTAARLRGRRKWSRRRQKRRRN